MIFTFVIWCLTCCAINGEYAEERARIIREEANQTIGGDIELTEDEVKVNECLMKYKLETQYTFQNRRDFNTSYHYFLYKKYIEKSTVYKIIKDLPKGAVLHVHDTGVLGPDYLLQLTYMDDLYMCRSTYRFLFASNSSAEGCEKWELVKDLRNASNNEEFDEELRSHFTMFVDNPVVTQVSNREAWDAFDKYFETVTGLITYRPVWEKYVYDSLKQFREHNIMYVEFRSSLPNLYELNGTVLCLARIGFTYQRVFNKFVSDYPEFIGAKLIYSPGRNVEKKQLTVYLDEAKQVKDVIGSTLAGFDLSGYETSEKGTLAEFAPELLDASNDMDFFFHAGETNWYGNLADENLIDAILLGTLRLGQAYSLMKHPELVKEVIANGIGLEVNVISNNVMSLVSDVRNHPLALFIANGLPVVLSSDAPGAWDADVISHDFYTAFVAVASRSADLRLLKQLAINSLKYSALQRVDKMAAINRFSFRWQAFMESFQCSDYQMKNEIDSEFPTTVPI